MTIIHNMTTDLTRTSNSTAKVNHALSFLRSRIGNWLGFSHDGDRDLYATFGYPRQIAMPFLWGMYLRGGIANRIIRAFSQATWKECPMVGDADGDSPEEGDSYSEFSHEFDNLAKRMHLMHYIERADRISTIGRYGALVMGFKDGQDLDVPMTGQAELMYLSPYSEMNITISKWDSDVKSTRYGLPEMYQVTGASVLDGGSQKGPAKAFPVHHTRLIHFAEFLEEDDVFATPRLLPIINHLMDLDKTVGGSAETFWLTANRGVAIWADKEAIVTKEDKEDMKKQLENFTNQQQRWLVGQGMEAQVMGSEAPDPGPNAEKLLDLIGGTTRIPKRILIGSERGELASSQDENAWNSVIDERRNGYAGPRCLRPFIHRMIETGNLPEPKQKPRPTKVKVEAEEESAFNLLKKQEESKPDFDIRWPETSTIGPVEESTIMVNKANALKTYVTTPGIEEVCPAPEFRRDVMGWEPESEYDPIGLEQPLEIDPNTGLPIEKPGNGAPGGGTAPGDDEDEGDDDKAAANASAPRTLYVSRRVLNAPALVQWAKKQGFKNIKEDPHVTICYSTTPLDWMTVQPTWTFDDENDGKMMVQPGGARVVEGMGKVIGLKFSSATLQARHEDFRHAGASHGFLDYQPHVTICSIEGNEDVDLSEVEPYTGAIALGPEIFEEIKE